MFFRGKLQTIPQYYQDYSRRTPAHDLDAFGLNLHHTDDLNTSKESLKTPPGNMDYLNQPNHTTSQSNISSNGYVNNIGNNISEDVKDHKNSNGIKVSADDETDDFHLRPPKLATPPLSQSQRSPR